jgi:hypothetical protein
MPVGARNTQLMPIGANGRGAPSQRRTPDSQYRAYPQGSGAGGACLSEPGTRSGCPSEPGGRGGCLLGRMPVGALGRGQQTHLPTPPNNCMQPTGVSGAIFRFGASPSAFPLGKPALAPAANAGRWAARIHRSSCLTALTPSLASSSPAHLFPDMLQ